MKPGFLKTFGVLAIASTIAIGIGSSDAEAKKVRWKMHAAFGQNVKVLGPPPHRIAKGVERMSDGDFDIKVFEPGALAAGTPISILSVRVRLIQPSVLLGPTRAKTPSMRSCRPGRLAPPLRNSLLGSSMAVVLRSEASFTPAIISNICSAA